MDLYEPTKLVNDLHNAADAGDPIEFESCWTALHQILKDSELEPALAAELLLGPRSSVLESLKLTLTFAIHGKLGHKCGRLPFAAVPWAMRSPPHRERPVAAIRACMELVTSRSRVYHNLWVHGDLNHLPCFLLLDVSYLDLPYRAPLSEDLSGSCL